jgi:hypothetical protein
VLFRSPRFPIVTTTLATLEYRGIIVPDCEIYHRRHLLAYVHRNTLNILPRYAWNGMTLYPEKEATATHSGNKIDSLTHDFHYQTGLIPRKPADQILANMARLHDDFHWAIYLGVRLGGWRFYNKDPDIRIIRESQTDDFDSADETTYHSLQFP